MTRCQTCGKESLDRSQFCDECGSRLSLGVGHSTDIPDHRPQTAETPIFRSANVTSVGIPPLVEPRREASNDSNGQRLADAANSTATLVIERGEAAGREFVLTGAESNIGRWDADNGIFPDVDLDSHDQEAKVSRRHARIIVKEGNYYVEDLGSTNGTYVNRGRRLLPGNPQSLADGDEIIVGKTFLRFHIKD